jgi:hypothetical protein
VSSTWNRAARIDVSCSSHGALMTLKTYSADEARGSEIILRQRWEKIIFLGGLAGTVFLLVIAQFIFS